ncbi:putative MIF4G-like, type 3, initiation factor eIF-4 gamma, MA3, MIF4G-like domain superfamily [Helianthus annuus]|uniref:MIF4G-like, type 3, initiation factor eIF-4 gamma, MA3, MIF4G-like domain superfamily n=1 Tax=Helianthus annuus TaxID=4232 RepID=A0A251VKP6_HELAN|nr:nucleolar MIF4G domain-containing protein 1 [Helianthus annuus]XP_022026676.1 nucleolar MIF4G domain-containing protein 1 [Helianthus annuus]XP_022026677.1 nucleolar MIF4G domain-containing protein 1 [Helianthus annuus]XP_022026678.1 nucleolar MIF4G domain-containing protein 1 [Helianthus annuus]KAF5820240.1 putative MIF4G-like, type 3, initiation factor eIF-4 gamma, MA3, MIF4G-like domain superfamily [Helianthus annuus]KAJ0620308.1 putative MIF4G-like, type 3, initiation factor eIF-4 gamma
MGNDSEDKTRRERRKETRLQKKKKKFDTWVQHHKLKKTMSNQKAENMQKNTLTAEEKESISGDLNKPSKPEFEECMETQNNGISADTEGGEASRNSSSSHKKHKRTVSSRNDDQLNTSLEPTRKKKAKFEKYMELENNGVTCAKEDLALERKLAKKLKVKNRKLGGDEDGLNMLFEGFESLETEDMEEASIRNISRNKKSSKKDAEIKSDDLVEELETELATEYENNDAQALVMEKHAKYVPPQLRSMSRNESEEYSQIRKRVRGLLNRLGESNVEGITGEMSSIFQSISRSVGAQIISEEILTSCSSGPRGNEQYAAVFAALVSGLACLVGIDFGAKLLASLAKCFEDEYQKEDNLSLRNLTLLLSYLYIFGVCSSDLIYDFMMMLSSRLTEVDVSTILTVLNCSGMRLRSDDPTTMKNFIVSIQNKVTELKTMSGDSQGNTTSKRMEFMLETIFDIKNNKKKAKEESLQHTRIKKWLQKLRVESILVRGLKWSKLLDPEKKGQWWLSGEMMSSTTNGSTIENYAKKMDKESSEAQKMLQLAAGQRMNTDARRAIFCIIMSGEDYIDAFEKLLRLDLQGKQDREMMRVLVECCLQEKVFNKYYCVLASKLCNHDKNHKFTLQYCIWDQYTELESMQLMRSMHLAKFKAEVVSSFTLSLAVLKKADLHDTTKLTCRKIMHFKMFFEAVFEYADNVVWNIFKRIAGGGSGQYETLRTGIKFFIERYVLGNEKQFAGKYKIAKKALKSVEEEEEDPFL